MDGSIELFDKCKLIAEQESATARCIDYEYQKVYFRISSGYRYGSGWDGMSEAQIKRFHEESNSLFASAGWHIEPERDSCYCASAVKGNRSLYLHPMEFSGVIRKDEIGDIEALLGCAKTFCCTSVDVFREYADISDADYDAYLQKCTVQIETAILKRYKTARKNLFMNKAHAEFQINRVISEEIRIYRMSDHDKSGCYCDPYDWDRAHKFVDAVMERMIRQGKLITTELRNGQRGIRAATEKEIAALEKKSLKEKISGILPHEMEKQSFPTRNPDEKTI